MANPETEILESPASTKELTLTRIYDAPRELVFKAWIDPIQMQKWWGPKFFTNPLCEVDARPGGKIRIDMMAPNSVRYPMGGHFEVIEAPERLVFITTAEEHSDGTAELENRNTITFEDLGGKTKLTVHVKVLHATEKIAGALSGMKEGWSGSLDKLETLLRSEEPARSVILDRVYHAPVEKVWEALTDAGAMRKWFFDVAEFKPEVGFAFDFQGGPPEKLYLHLCKVTEVIPMKKLAYTWRFDGYVGDSLLTFELWPNGDDTKLRLSHLGIETFAPITEPGFDLDNFNEGWQGVLDKSLKPFLERK